MVSAAPEGGYSALNPETGTASQGDTEAEALANLVEATKLYLEEFPPPAARRSAACDHDIPHRRRCLSYRSSRGRKPFVRWRTSASSRCASGAVT